jgi:dCTP deaminase
MILTGPEITRLVRLSKTYFASEESSSIQFGHKPASGFDPERWIDIEPFVTDQVNPNSYDLTLSPKMLTYDLKGYTNTLDARKDNPVNKVRLKEQGGVLRPGILYLGSTIEATGCGGFAPMIETKSSIARLGVSVHLSAGFGDDGFRGRWTLEITAVHPVRLYPRMRICQVAFVRTHGERQPYKGRYQNQGGATPSRYHEDQS